MIELEEAISLIDQNPDEAFFVGSRDEVLIAEAEEALGLTFSPTYRRFLSELGEGSFGGAEFLGVIDQASWSAHVRDGIGQTLHARERWELSTSMVLVENDGMGGYDVLDAAKPGADGEYPVFYWEPGRHKLGSKLDQVATDFGTFFRDEIRTHLWG